MDENMSVSNTKLNSDLKDAINACDINKVKELVELGADIHTDDGHALKYSSLNGSIEIVIFLLENGADPRLANDVSLKWACGAGHFDIVKQLVKHGANIHGANESPLVWASNSGHINIVKYLVENGVDINIDEYNATQHASTNGYLNVVKYLVEHGAAISNDKNNAIVRADEYNKLDIVSYLETVPEVIIESILLNQEFHTIDNIKSIINSLYKDMNDESGTSEPDKYKKNKQLKILTRALNDIRPDNTVSDINNQNV